MVFFVFCWTANVYDLIKPTDMPHIIPGKNKLNVRMTKANLGEKYGTMQFADSGRITGLVLFILEQAIESL